jgi:G3E family GTPase
MQTELSDSFANVLVCESIPLTILTGFLGAGKTTLLNRILTSDHGRRVAVLVNDFGSINIDAELVVGVEENMISLANGCVCCEIRDDLLESVERLIHRSELPEHILLEASGVADPAGIWATFAASRHPRWLHLDGVLCVVDCEQIFAHLDEVPELLMLKARQIGFADIVLLNKIDLVSMEVLDYVRTWIDTMMDRVRMLEVVRCQVPVDVLLGVSRDLTSARGVKVDADRQGHQQQFSTWTFKTEKAFDETALRDMISRRLPAAIYRCKGFVRIHRGELPFKLLQSVGRRTELTPAPEATGPSRIVAIGRKGLDPDHLRDVFESCLVNV